MECSDVQPLTQNIRVGGLVWYFDPRIIPGTSHKLRSFWAEPYRVTKQIAPALAEIIPVSYPGQERLVSLDVLKLYRGEEVIRQNPEDIDRDQWLDEEELKELPEIPREEAEERVGNKAEDPGTPEADTGLYLEIPIFPEDTEVLAEFSMKTRRQRCWCWWKRC